MSGKQLRVGLIGCGHISTAHLVGWARTSRSKVSAVYDLDAEVARRTAKQFDIQHVAGSTAEILEMCDVVDICTPPQAHAEQIMAALEHSRHVLIEKPVVLSVAEWMTVAARLEASASALAVVHHLKFLDSVRRAGCWIEDGRIGRLLRIDGLFLTNPRHDRMLTASGHWSHALAGGRWLETLPHNLYLLHALAGPLEVRSVASVATRRRPAGVSADEVTVTLGNQELLATIHFSAHCELNVRRSTIVGSCGIIRLDLLSDLATLHRIGDSRANRAVGRDMLEGLSQAAQAAVQRPMNAMRRLRSLTPHAVLIQAFEHQLLDAGPPPTPLDEIDYVVRTCEAIGREIDASVAR